VTRRTLLVVLLYAFFTLLVAMAVTMGGYLLATAVQDSQLAPALRIIGVGCLLLLGVNALLLLLAVATSVLVMEEERAAARNAERATDEPPAENDIP
jgi:hypothetical protein